MKEQGSPALETPDQARAGGTHFGWGFWALWVLALAAAGALSYCVASLAPWASLTLPPAAMMLFGFLAGGVQAFAFRRQGRPARWWILISSLAGFLAAFVSVLTTSLAESAPGLLAGWAYVWAVYGAVSGIMLQRVSPGHWAMLASIAGWAAAGIVSGAVGLALDVFLVTERIPTPAFFVLPDRTWSMAGLGIMGAVCGATGGAITGAALVLLSRGPVPAQDNGVKQAKDKRLVNAAGVVSGLFAAVLCTYLAPLVVTALAEGSLESLDLTIYFLGAIYRSPVCIPAIAVVTIPLAIGCGWVGLEMGRAVGRTDPWPWVWCGAALGGVAGYLLGSLVAFAIGYLGG